MNEEFALQYAAIRAREKGYPNYRIVYRAFTIAGNQEFNLKAYNELWLITHSCSGISVRSSTGKYDLKDLSPVSEQILEHSDQITIVNTTTRKQTIRFLQVILKT